MTKSRLIAAFSEIETAFRRSETASWMASAGEDLARRAAEGERNIATVRQELAAADGRRAVFGAEEDFEAIARARRLELAAQRTVAAWLQRAAKEEP